MEMESFILFRGPKRLTMKQEDMSADKICRIFQVSCSSLYITDDSNTAIFPEPAGHFSIINRTNRSHYEVHGDAEHLPSAAGAPAFGFMRRPSPASASATSFSASGFSTETPPPPPRAGTPRASGASLFQGRSFQRSIHLAEIVNEKLSPSRTVVVRFLEAEACVERISAKVQDAVGSDEPITLTDTQGNEIMDSEGTRSSQFWKQNSRKIYAVPESDFVEFQNGRRAKTSRRDGDSSLQEVLGRVDQLKQAAGSLQEVTNSINQLSQLAKSQKEEIMANVGLQPLKEAFACLVCKAVMADPMFATCCESIIGCRTCVELWLVTSDHCLKCRAGDFENKIHEVKGLSAALSLFKERIIE
ncbi:unnamed protein product [Arctogadus glacialis]